MFLLNTLAKYEPDYFHISANSYQRTSIVNQEDTEPLINKYHKMQSAQLAQIPLIGVGSIAQRKDANMPLNSVMIFKCWESLFSRTSMDG